MVRLGLRRQLQLYFFILGFGAVAGALIGAIVGPMIFDPPLYGAIVIAAMGAIDTLIVSVLIGAAEIFGFRTRLGRAVERAPFLAVFLIKLLAYGAINIAVIASHPGRRVVFDLIVDRLLAGTDFLRAIDPRVKSLAIQPEAMMAAYTVVVLILFIWLLQLSRVVGERAFRDIALGRYHRSRTEERFFLFVDIIGSTPLAERIGPDAVHRFLDRVFQLASGPIDDHGGEVYQYVGDEVVITWTLAEGQVDARPLACFFAIEREIRLAAHRFEQEFGTVPRLRAALHAGQVITGEVGNSPRSIVFHGDVMNTTARIEGATRDLQRPFLVSEDAITRLEGKERYRLEDLGPQQLRGRAAPMRVYAVESDASQLQSAQGQEHRLRFARAGFFIGLAVVIGGLAWLALRFDPAESRSTTGFVSRTLCSGIFVSGLDPARAHADILKPIKGIEQLGPALRFEVDRTQRVVKSTMYGMFESRAQYHEGFGCILLRGEERLPAWFATGAGTALPVSAGKVSARAESEILEPRFRAAIDQGFAETEQSSLRRTIAIVVLHEGRIVAERYAPGYRADTPLVGRSVSKSVMNALVGILVRERRLVMDRPAPVRQWKDPNDPRHAITVDHLLRMTSGLDLEESNRRYDPIMRMLFIESDMAGFAERASLKNRPGERWEYTSGNTMILSRILRDSAGGTAGDVLAFARRELFEPLGMRNVTLEFDVTGTPIGGSFIYASARDWARFGTLYLEDGVVDGRRILPEGWVRYSSSRTLASNYAAGFWLGAADYRARWKFPDDAFYASGIFGQRIMIIPSKRLVIARFGNSDDGIRDIGFGRLVSDVLAAL